MGGMTPDICADEMEDLVYGLHEGYLEGTAGERHRKAKEIVLMDKPKSDEVPLGDVIFNSKFKRDIKEKYERDFGRTDIERNLLAPRRFADLEYSNGVRVTPEEDVHRKKIFGEYVIRKLLEHHVDNYFKSNPSVKPIYEIKERISHLDVKTKGGYKFKLGYSYAGNHVKLRVENPYKIRNRLILQMDSDRVGPSEIKGVIIYLGYDFTKKVGVDSYYDSKKESLKIIGYHKVSSTLTTSISGISEKGGFKQEEDRVERKILFGLSWTY